jgi:hypothetical protein
MYALTRPPKSHQQQNFCFSEIPLDAAPKSPLHLQLSRSGRGALAIVTNVGTGCGGRGSVGAWSCWQGGLRFRERTQRADERCCCVRQNRVVLTPQWLVSSLRRPVGPTGRGLALIRRRRRQTSPILRGDHDISRQTIAQGMSGCPRLYLYARVRFLHSFAHETAGAASTRHSLRPLDSGANDFAKPRAHRAAGSRSCI